MELSNQKLEEIRQTIKLTLIKIGIRCDLTGFQYICYGVECVIKNPSIIDNLCKDLYIEIAKKHNLKHYSTIERNIRHAIDLTFRKKGFYVLNEMFNTTLYTKHQKPTSGELIRLVSEYYLLGLYKNVT